MSIVFKQSNQRQFLHLVELMLLFQRGTHQGIWELNLLLLELFTKFFFTFDQINYARLAAPIHLPEMFALKTNNPNTWNFFQNGHFSVDKSSVPFSALDKDHALEQEYKKMKILCGIIGIANKLNHTEQPFHCSPILRNIVNRFYQLFCNTKSTSQI